MSRVSVAFANIGKDSRLIGNRILLRFAYIGNFFQLLGQSFWLMAHPKVLRKITFQSRSLVEQMGLLGFDSIPIVCLINFFIGMILAMQSSYQLQMYGAVNLVSPLVSIAITREIAPLLSAAVLAGRVGAAIAAELGTMRVSEEIEALESLSLNPVQFLIVPRLLSLLLMLPCLVIFADVVGIAGGYTIGVLQLGIPSNVYISSTFDFMLLKDVVTGLVKSVSFGLIIGMVGCYYGFNVKGGASGVGKAATAAVVQAILFVVLADVFFTGVFTFVIK